MAVNYTQTDTAASCTPAAFCSGRALEGSELGRLCQAGGTAGSSEASIINIANNTTNEILFTYDIEIANGTTWGAGTANIRINFTTGDTDVTLTEVYVCRVNSGCTSQETLGSNTGLSVDTSTAGNHTENVTLSAASSPSDGDKVEVVLVFSNASAHGGEETIGITPDQDHTLPFTAPAAGEAPAPMMHSF